jgi:lysophospholipase L1-like esterase
MAGPLSEGPPSAPPSAVKHGGWPGIRISGGNSPGHTEGLVQAAGLWGSFAARADVILLHIGTNDILQNQYVSPAAAAADMGGQLAGLLALIHQLAPRAMTCVASIISFAPTEQFAAFNAQVAAYNSAIPFIVDGYIAGGGRAAFVDMATQSTGTCASANSCCPGGIHPTVVGYADMARVWHEALTKR